MSWRWLPFVPGHYCITNQEFWVRLSFTCYSVTHYTNFSIFWEGIFTYCYLLPLPSHQPPYAYIPLHSLSLHVGNNFTILYALMIIRGTLTTSAARYWLLHVMRLDERMIWWEGSTVWDPTFLRQICPWISPDPYSRLRDLLDRNLLHQSSKAWFWDEVNATSEKWGTCPLSVLSSKLKFEEAEGKSVLKSPGAPLDFSRILTRNSGKVNYITAMGIVLMEWILMQFHSIKGI